MKKVMILGYGGTIAMVANQSGALVPAKGIEEIVRHVPALGEMADVSWRELENLDSTNINPGHWTRLIMEISSVSQEVDGIIVTHGTDTMAYTASAVAFGVGRGLKVPVVFTGSQLPLMTVRTDARFNLENAMSAVLEANRLRINEVMISFSYDVLRGCRAIKVSEARFDAFDSPAFPALGLISATGISFSELALRHGDHAVLNTKPHFQRGILVVELVPGIEPGLLMGVIRSGNCKGILLKSLGSGNVPSLDEYSLIPVIQEAGRWNIPVLVSTKFVGGTTHLEMYEPGKLALDAGAIPTGDMTDVAAQVKFMWALAQGHNSPEALRSVISTNYVGEISA